MNAERDRLRWSWPAEVSSVPTARHTVVESLRQRGTSDPPLSDVALVVSEAVTNAVLHAYLDRPPGEIVVEVSVEPDELVVLVEDDGTGMRPRLDSPGLGVGMALMAAVCTRLEAQRAAGGGTRLCAWFRRMPRAALSTT
jgi:serine/threonine-protein kinase RsbW